MHQKHYRSTLEACVECRFFVSLNLETAAGIPPTFKYILNIFIIRLWTSSFTGVLSTNDLYKVIVNGVEGATKIEISATLKEKNILGIYVDKHTSSGTYYSRSATLTGYYDMSTSKNYKVSAVRYVTANGVREKIEV